MLIDFRYVKDGIISGISGDQIEMITKMTTDVFHEDDTESFPDPDEEIIKTLNETEKMLLNNNTTQQTDHNKNMFLHFLSQNDLSSDFKMILNNFLDNFYLRFFIRKFDPKIIRFIPLPLYYAYDRP